MGLFSSIGKIFSGATKVLSPLSSAIPYASAGLSAYDAITSRNDTRRTNNYNQELNAQAQSNRDRDYNLSKDQFDKALQIRTKDAIAAGLHPMAALGLSPGGSAGGATAFIPGQTRDGSTTKNAISKYVQTQNQNKINNHQMELQERTTLSRIKLDNAQANYYNSMAAREAQKSNSQQDSMGPGGITFREGEKPADKLSGWQTVKPNEITSSRKGDKSQTAGNKPLWDTYTINKGKDTLKMPSADNPSETLESGGAFLLMMMHPHNIALAKKYGKAWLKREWENAKKNTFIRRTK